MENTFTKKKNRYCYTRATVIRNRNTSENIAFALEVMGSLPEEIEANKYTSDLVELNESAYKYPGQLSGGEATRVSIEEH